MLLCRQLNVELTTTLINTIPPRTIVLPSSRFQLNIQFTFFFKTDQAIKHFEVSLASLRDGQKQVFRAIKVL